MERLAEFTRLKKVAPFPWYIDQCNAGGVCVKDNHGDTIFYEDFGTIPDEMTSNQADDIRERAITLAQFLVELTNRCRP